MSYFPFPGCEEFCNILAMDPSIPRVLIAIIEGDPIFKRALYKAMHFNKQYYLYVIDCDASHFGDRMGIHEIHVATNLQDLQRAFGTGASVIQ